MLKTMEYENLQFLKSKNNLPQCMGFQDKSQICEGCGFKKVCKVVRNNKLKEFIIRGEPRIYYKYIYETTFDPREFHTKIVELVKEMLYKGLSEEEIILEMEFKGYPIRYKETFRKVYLSNNDNSKPKAI